MDVKSGQELDLRELIAATTNAIEAKNYNTDYLVGIKRQFNRLQCFCEEHGIDKFSMDVAERFMLERYHVQPGEYIRKFSHAHRAMDMLSDYQQLGVVMIRRRKGRTFPMQFAKDTTAYLSDMERNGRRANTVRSHKNSLLRFTDFLDSVGINDITSVTTGILRHYVKTVICYYSKNSGRLHYSIMENFIKFLHGIGRLDNDPTIGMVKVRSTSAPAHLPSTFTEDEVRRMLNAVDRESPQGKRDYAVLLLASRLGLRTSDIKQLKPQHIDWDNHRINLIQVKTGEPLSLPLPNDVGWAIIDYVKNGRPKSDAPEIFLRLAAPYVSLTNFDNILVKYMRLAGVSAERLKHHGLHILRHTTTTRMLEKGVPITAIQGVLGHVNCESTMTYIGIDTKQLTECALEVPPV